MSNTKRWYCSRCLTSFAHTPLECPNLSCQIERPERGWGVIHEPGDIFDRRFYIHSCLAIGGSGIAYLAKELDDHDQQKGPFVAVKVLFVLRSSGTYLRRLATEAQILESLEHPNIIQYRGFAHFSGQSPYLITLFAQGGSLLDHLKRHGPLTMRAAAEVGRQICWALECAHEKGVIHRDLKPENILLDRKTDPEGPFSVRVADFGIAKVQSSLASHLTRTGAFMGTPHYAAPEQFTGSNVDVASDVFSVVVMLYHCMTGQHLVPIAAALHSFSTEEIDELFRSRLPLTFDGGQGTPEERQLFQQLFAEALLMEPEKRCTMARVLEFLEAVLGNVELSQTATTQMEDKVNKEPLINDDTETVPLEAPVEKTDNDAVAQPPNARIWISVVAVITLIILFVVGSVAVWVQVLHQGYRPISGESEELQDRQDYVTISTFLDAHHKMIGDTCQIPAKSRAMLDLRIEKSGLIEQVAFTWGSAEIDFNCLSAELKKLRVPRSQQRKIALQKKVRW